MVLAESTAQYISIPIEAHLYGVYTVLLVVTLTLIIRRSTEWFKRPVILLALLMYLLSTTHMAFVVARGIYLFIADNSIGSNGPSNAEAAVHLFTLQSAVVFLNCLIADSILIWRVWIVWGKKYWVIVAPMCTLIASVVTGLLFADPAFKLSAVQSGTASFGPVPALLTLLTNLVCTGMIAGRIWFTQRRLSLKAGSPSKRALLLVLESGAVYSAAWAASFFLFLVNSFASGLVTDTIAQLAGIIPTVIILLPHLHLTSGDAGTSASGQKQVGQSSSSIC